MYKKIRNVDRVFYWSGDSKILLAETYEEAMEIISRYRHHLLGVISDVSFPKDGKMDPEERLAHLAGTYSPQDDCIYDSAHHPGPKVLTFAGILKYDALPLAPVAHDLLEMDRVAFGSEVEIEFAVNIPTDRAQPVEFFFLQIRPMVVGGSASCLPLRSSAAPPGAEYLLAGLGGCRLGPCARFPLSLVMPPHCAWFPAPPRVRPGRQQRHRTPPRASAPRKRRPSGGKSGKTNAQGPSRA